MSVRGTAARMLVTAVAIAAGHADASAEWLVAGYVGAAHTASTTLRITPDQAPSFELPRVNFRGESWHAPIYYGYRVSWRSGQAPFGVEAEFTHAKTIAVDTMSPSLTHFAQSHGLNFVLANATYQRRAGCAGRCVVVGRAGAGITIPHVEATYLGASVSAYQFGGPAFQVGAGLEVTVHGSLTAIADGRLTYARITGDLRGATLSSAFRTWHFTFGAGWRFRL